MRSAALMISLGLFLSGCPKNEEASTKPQPTPQAATEAAAPDRAKAPDEYTVELQTTRGPIVIDVRREWAPKGADRFYELVKEGYYSDVAFFRVVPGFVVQFGMSGDPQTNAEWSNRPIGDDPVKASNARGTVTFATSGKNSRTTQIFINLGNNARLDAMGFSPFGKVRDMNTVEGIYSGYREQPNQGMIRARGNAYLRESFPKLDYIESAKIIE
jgi:peptidyl-prolyl cis-trans isomerase A (cyclophilin A)